jgi:uncharacterized caspase-like protein
MRKLVLCALAGSLAAQPALAAVQRVALVVGANDGGSGRTRLKYAVADAERFARVLHDLGGVDSAQAIVLRQPSPRQIEDAFDTLRARIDALKAAGAERTEAVVYYSGHADQNGLLLSDDRLSYRTFRDFMERLPADVRIGVIDACASGAITRIKGGQVRPPFVVDAANSMRGHAFLTSSSANEVAQESDRIAASFFTHYLVSGLRGAADVSGEGTVTLGEAYQFAFRETLGRTAETRAGAQHPSYDLNLSGTGDVVITDVRQTSARLALGEELGGRCFVRDAEQRLVVELLKPKGRAIELGLAPGVHEVRCQEKERALLAKITLQEGRQVALGPADFAPGTLDRAVARGDDAGDRGLTGTIRLDAGGGQGTDFSQRQGGVSLSRWFGRRLALTFDAGQRIGARRHVAGKEGFGEEEPDLATFLAGGRRYLRDPASARLGPFLEASAGVYARWTAIATFETRIGPNGRPEELGIIDPRHVDLKPAARLGLGLDVRLGDSVILGTRTGYVWVGAFQRPRIGPVDYTGFESSISAGLLIGGSRKR